jgi:hypothetical protein
MALVLAKLVKSLAVLCILASLAILGHVVVWGLLSFTHVREHGIAAVTDPERAIVAPAKAQAVGAKPTEKVDQPPVQPKAAGSGSDTALRVAIGVSTAVGVGALALLPVILLIGFVTALVRAPRAAASCMGGALWALGLVALALPWSSLFAHVPWDGLFRSYETLVRLVAEAEATGGPLRASPLVTHVAVPFAAIAVLVAIVWRCGDALHVELLAAESLAVDPSLERDAARTAARGAFVPTGRTASSLGIATGSPVPAAAAEEPEAMPRRLI